MNSGKPNWRKSIRIVVIIAVVMYALFTSVGQTSPSAQNVLLGNSPALQIFFGLMTFIAIVAQTPQTQSSNPQSGSTNITQPTQAQTPNPQLGSPTTEVSNIPSILLGITLLLYVPVIIASFSLIGTPMKIPSSALAAFGTMVFGCVMMLIAIRLRVSATGTQCDKTMIRTAILVAANVVSTALLRWLHFSFIDAIRFPQAVLNLNTFALPSDIIDSALFAHGSLFASSLLFVTCIVVMLECRRGKGLSLFAYFLTAGSVIFTALMIIEYRHIFLVSPSLDTFGDAYYVAGKIDFTNNLSIGVVVLFLAVVVTGLLRISFLAFENRRKLNPTDLIRYQFRSTILIVLFAVLEIVALLRLSNPTLPSFLNSFPHLEIALVSGLFLVIELLFS